MRDGGKHTLLMVLKNNFARHLSKHTAGLNFLPLLAESNFTAGCCQSFTETPFTQSVEM